ncbi:MAG: hypothetical protein ABFD18_06085 [Syntrophomonas sp.]
MSLSWTKYSPLSEASLQDPLAFDYFAQVLGNIVLPTFTTRTSRARYYSVVCYGIYISHKYLESMGMPVTENGIMQIFALFEKYWARAVVGWYLKDGGGIAERDGNENDLRGKRGAINAANNASLTTLGEDYKLLSRQLELGGFGAYRSSLENLQLVNQFLHLTHKGKKLAGAFADQHFDRLVLAALKSQSIRQKEGLATINSFGANSRLDGFLQENEFHAEERQLLREMVMDHPLVSTPAALIKRYYTDGNALTMIERISCHESTSEKEEAIVKGYTTIGIFEKLCVHINKVWCTIIEAAMDKMNLITPAEATTACGYLIDVLYGSSMISELMHSPCYYNLANSFHGTSFDILLRQHVTPEHRSSFILDLVRYHIEIMKRRHSGSWMQLDGSNILVLTGFDYPHKTKELSYLHAYKTGNVMSLIADTGWEANA